MNYNRMISSRVRDFFFVALLITSFSIAACTSSMGKKGDTLSSASPSAPVASLKKITHITTADTTDSTTVSIKGTDQLTYTSVKQPFPLAVVLYFPETEIDRSGLSVAPDSDVVSSIETSGPTPNSPASKINILLKRDAAYEVLQQSASLDVVFRKTPGMPAASRADEAESRETDQAGRIMAVSDIESKEAAAPSGGSGSLSSGTQAEKPAIASSGKPAWVNKIDFVSEEAGKSTILIGTSHPVDYNVEKVSENRLNLNLLNANIPDYRQRQLITTRFESAVDRIIPVQTSKMRGNSLVSIELRESVPYYVEQSENLISIHFEASAIPPRPLENAELPAWKNIVTEAEAEPEMEAAGSVESRDQESGTIHETDQYFQKKVYTGEKIALDFYETDIKNVFRILREISGKNFIIDDDVKGKVTMTLDKPVPWDQVLDLVLKMNQLGLLYEDDIIRIATLKTIEKESKALMDSVTAERESKEKIKDLAPLSTEYISISYSKAKDEILPHLQNIITKERGTITVDERNNQIIMTDTAEKIVQAKEIVKNIDKVTPQVIIEAKIVEISSKAAREIGVDWSMSGGIQGTDANAGIGPQRGFDILGGTYGWNTAMNYPSTSTSGIGFNFTRIAGTPFVLDAQLNALASSDDVKIVSAPKIVTLDNKKAKISQGLEVGYYDTQEGTEEGQDVEWKNVDLLLEVTPHVTPDSRISMNIVINKNEVAGYFDAIPQIATNEAETELLINDGDTIVIGGIMKTTQSFAESNFPGLSKVPILGWLFKTELKNEDNRELLIFITPRIVQLEQKPM